MNPTLIGFVNKAFLLALAGELVPHNGTVEKQKGLSVALATQDPWIMNGSVRENILMGRPFDQVFYTRVITACGLDVDFEQFIDNDDTIVGDRGVQCSGGQVSPFVKHRISAHTLTLLHLTYTTFFSISIVVISL